MIADAELDRILEQWLLEGVDRAPQDDVAAALRTAADTRQRSGRLRANAYDREAGWSRAWAVVAAAMLLVVLSLALAVAGGARPQPPAPTAAPDGELDGGVTRFHAHDGPVSVGLPSAWTRSTFLEDTFFRTAAQRLTIRSGAEDGSIITCDDPAGPWERCGTVTVHSLEELVDQLRFTGAIDHGVAPGPRTETAIEVDGEPAVLLRIKAYEYPARGGQEVAYIAAWHAGRPYLLRIHTTANEIRDLDTVVDGLRFGD